jgi:uncharacterized protein (DUF924 family)
MTSKTADQDVRFILEDQFGRFPHGNIGLKRAIFYD